MQNVAKLREDAAMLKLFADHVKGEEMYGLTVHAVLRITESVWHGFQQSDNRLQVMVIIVMHFPTEKLTSLVYLYSFQEWRIVRTTRSDMAAIPSWSFLL